MTCAHDGCERASWARGWCLMHYKRWRKHGHTFLVSQVNWNGTPDERFARYTGSQLANGCIPWTGALNKGYGVMHLGGRVVAAHRFAWERLNGHVPDGLILDHTCHNGKGCPSTREHPCEHRRCVNPDHLEPVTIAENNARGEHRRRWPEIRRAMVA